MQWIPFIWSSDTLGGRQFEKTAIFVEGEVEPLGDTGIFQLDLGAPHSLLYGRSFQEDALKPFITEKTLRFNRKEIPVTSLKIVVSYLKVENPALLKDFGGDDEIQGKKILGTVGLDMVKGKVLVLDFTRNLLSVGSGIPRSLSEGVIFTQMHSSPYGHILIDAQVDGKKTKLMYDSGSSIFGLLTTREIWEKLTDGIVIDSFPIHAWGDEFTVYAGKLKSEVKVGDITLPIKEAHYVNIPGGEEFFKSAGIMAIVGNRPFWNTTVILDFKEGKFGMVKPSNAK